MLPVSVAIAKVAADYRLTELTVLDAPAFRPQEIVRRFWQGWQHYDRPTLVTFNGRGYDMPIMETGGLSIRTQRASMVQCGFEVLLNNPMLQP